MALELSTAGILVKWCTESSVGSRPTTNYNVIHGVKSIPEFGTDVNTLQSTDLSAQKNHTYVLGLSDSGGAIGLTVNDYETFRDDWDDMLTAYATAKAAGKALWVEYAYPPSSGLDSFYYPAEPSELGFGGADVDEVLENVASFVPTGDFLFAAASTTSP